MAEQVTICNQLVGGSIPSIRAERRAHVEGEADGFETGSHSGSTSEASRRDGASQQEEAVNEKTTAIVLCALLVLRIFLGRRRR